MSDEAFYKLAKVLDTLPSGFPATENGLEIRILKKIFTPEEADLFCDLRLSYETAEQIAKRTGRPMQGLEEMLTSMWERGEILSNKIGNDRVFKMIPWVLGIYEWQNNRMDKEFAALCEEYGMHWGTQFLMNTPQLMQVLPIEKEIPDKQQALSYHQVSADIENGETFAVAECICKKSKGLQGTKCDKPLHVCLGINPKQGAWDPSQFGRPISKEEAYEVLRISEEAGLVHLTSNYESGHWYICNCCGCCCGMLQAINMGFPNTSVVNSYYYAEIDPDACTACGICADERCQIKAIEAGEDSYRVVQEKCIGCGLCVSACPSQAIRLVPKSQEKWALPARDEEAWFEERGRSRGVDFSAYK